VTGPAQPDRSARPDRPARAGDRDRDPAGRPRNARPRDAAGRPLARGVAGEPPAPDAPALPPAEALREAQSLLDADRPFRAHEVLEAAWKAAPPGERDLWRGLAQIAVGLTHAQRGNSRGAVALLRRGAERISACPGAPHGVDTAAAAGAARALASQVERDGLPAPGHPRLRIRLLPR
jgi:uncharacterized protein